jgi:MFS family permease
VIVNGLILFAMQFATSGLLVYASVFLGHVVGLTPFGTGLALLPLMLPIPVFAQLSGRLLDRVGEYRPVVIGLALTLLGILAVTAALPARSYLPLLPGLALVGIGSGLTFSPANTAALKRVPAADHGQAAGMLQTMLQLGAAIGLASMAALIAAVQPAHLETPSDEVAGTAAAFLLAAAVLAPALAIGAIALPRNKGNEEY